MGFVRGAWRLLVGVKDALVLIFMLLFFGTLLAVLSYRPNPIVVREGALLVDLNGTVVEEPEEIDIFNVALGGEAPVRQYRQRDVIRAIKGAASDDKIKAVVLNLDGFLGAGQVTLQQISEAIDEVKKAKKPVLTFATYYSDDAYLLASHSSEIWLDPMGGVAFSGPGGTQLYFKSLIDRLKINVHVYRVGTFKSAVEPFLRNDQSPESEMALRAVYEPIWQNWLADVQKARPNAEIAAYAANPAAMVTANRGDMVQLARDAGLVDQVGDRVDFGRRVAKIVGDDSDKPLGGFKHTNMDDWVAANPMDRSGAEIGVVTIAGNIVDGEAGPGTAGGDRIVDLLEQGLKRDSIKALVVRVDSPGGSAFASERMRRAIEAYRARKIPVVISMGNVAASGGYWVATAGDMIFAEPSTITGSIGIFAVIPSFEKVLADIGVGTDGVGTTPLSGQPDLAGGFNESFDTLIQGSIENDYRRFLKLVGDARDMPVDKVDSIAQGRVWDGGTARQLKLVDRFGSLDEAAAEAARRAGLEGKDWHLRYLETEMSDFAKLAGSFLTPPDTASQGGGLVAHLAAQRQVLLGQVAHDLKMLTGTKGAQALCLECASATPARVDGGLLSPWLAFLALFEGRST